MSGTGRQRYSDRNASFHHSYGGGAGYSYYGDTMSRGQGPVQDA
eukprot:CAMPEP_0119283442 /NCGR_PEP_ID=MMETSP1329-20130426/28494_1 /TAXON_ID=114041 /ORGANISM="Genus nov. species nov., Strain RCC1024" /LENGTH=43 /DNA_ID= /DNA_START= /DNA_END= /DNA_ORIENTATION=